MQKNDEESAEKHRLVHSSFRIKENVSKALETEAQRRGVTNSSLVNKILEEYLTCDVYFEKLGFILVSKDFLRSVFTRLKEKEQIEEMGRKLGQIAATEYVSFFYPEVNIDTLIQFLGLWFRRFQLYQHRKSSGGDGSTNKNKVHSFTINHDININFSLALKSMLGGLIEPIALAPVSFSTVTDGIIAFSFESESG